VAKPVSIDSSYTGVRMHIPITILIVWTGAQLLRVQQPSTKTHTFWVIWMGF